MPISIRSATLGDAGAIMAFFRDHWSPDHVLARHRAVFDWQHRDETAGRYNFVLAFRDNGEICGVLGFIPISRYDSTLRPEDDTIWLTTWKVRLDSGSGLGLALLRAVSRMYPAAWIGTVGLNAATKGIYDALGYETGRLDRFFLLNGTREAFCLAVVPPAFRSDNALSDGTRLSVALREELLTLDVEARRDVSTVRPRKTGAYVVNRYLDHPFYDYTPYLLRLGADWGVIVVRTCVHEGARALRIADFLGTPRVLAGAGMAFRDLLMESDAEYLDFYCTGLAAELDAAGLRNVRDCEGLILPSHFEPFDRRNTDLLYALKGPAGRIVLTKGDADQDRPNRLGSE